jgi:hypothetical protein
VRRLAASNPATFSNNQHSIVQRLFRLLRRKAAKTAIVSMAASIDRGHEAQRMDAASSDGHSAPP